MTSTLEVARGLVLANRVRYTDHAWEQMAARGYCMEDVESCVLNGEATFDDGRKLKIRGPAADGEPFVVVCEVRNNVVVITVHHA